MADVIGACCGHSIAWTADDLRRALLRRAHFARAGVRRRRSGEPTAHAGVSRRVIRRLGLRAASSLVRGGNPSLASTLISRLVSGTYHDEQLLAIEVLERLASVWPEWSEETTALLSRGLRHPWIADRLALVQGKLLSHNPTLVAKHSHWATSQNPLRRRAAALALLPRRWAPGSRRLRAARVMPILRLLLEDPEPHPLVQSAVGRALAYYARRAPRTVSRLLGDRRDPETEPAPRHLDRARRLIEATQGG